MCRLVLAVALLAPVAARAVGGHDSVGCRGCHSTRASKDGWRFAEPPNTTYVNPRTKQSYPGVTALCFACHQEPANGGHGYLTISQHNSHPLGVPRVNPKVARVPSELLREEGRFECTSCHDPHPSNANYRYLRIDVGPTGERMDAFCAICHASKSDPENPGLSLFDRDERAPGSAPSGPAGRE
jgi:predicted CXXCH cytochrome family protein